MLGCGLEVVTGGFTMAAFIELFVVGEFIVLFAIVRAFFNLTTDFVGAVLTCDAPAAQKIV